MRWVILAIPGSLALLLVWSGIAGAINARALQSRGVRTKGTIVDAVKSGGRVKVYSPVIEFTGADGKSHRFDSYAGSKPTENEVEKGKSIDVVYDADNPARAVLAGSEGSVFGSLTSAVFGLLILGAIFTMTRNRESALAVAGSLRLVAVAILALVGLGFLLSGAAWGVSRYLLLQSGVVVEGAVIDHLPAARGGGQLAVIAFKSPDGAQHQFAASELTSYKEGARVKVVYGSDDPSKAVIHDFQQFWLGPLAVTAIGLFFAGLAALAWTFAMGAVVAVQGALKGPG